MVNDTFTHPLRPRSRGATNLYVSIALSLGNPAGYGQLGVAADKNKDVTTLSAVAAVEFGGRVLHSRNRTRDQQSTESSLGSRSHLRHWVSTATAMTALLPDVEWVSPAATCDSLCWCDQRSNCAVRNNYLMALMMMCYITPLRLFRVIAIGRRYVLQRSRKRSP